jgi:4-aminobutyrate aminotransferase / (S)-3-amino-2-methylpropionate transaminase / 5-aminovalerate transaminase
VAAIVLEPVQGEGGFIVAPPEFVAGVRRLCDRHGIVLVADEVQSGFGRTGRFFGIEHSGVEPDLICVAKSIANGLPLSGVVGRAEIMDAPAAGGVGGTFVGNPVAQAAALAVLDVIDEEALLDRSASLGETMRARLCSWQERFPEIGEVRGLGSMLAIELVADPVTRKPAKELAQRVTEAALQRGLLLITCGVYGNCIRVLVPLVISDAELEEALGAWEEALAAVLG